MTSKELDERIENLTWDIASMGDDYSDEKLAVLVKNLIKASIEAVTPERNDSANHHWNNAIYTIQANTKELLG